jgi:hypothetical protein
MKTSNDTGDEGTDPLPSRSFESTSTSTATKKREVKVEKKEKKKVTKERYSNETQDEKKRKQEKPEKKKENRSTATAPATGSITPDIEEDGSSRHHTTLSPPDAPTRERGLSRLLAEERSTTAPSSPVISDSLHRRERGRVIDGSGRTSSLEEDGSSRHHTILSPPDAPTRERGLSRVLLEERSTTAPVISDSLHRRERGRGIDGFGRTCSSSAREDHESESQESDITALAVTHLT